MSIQFNFISIIRNFNFR